MKNTHRANEAHTPLSDNYGLASLDVDIEWYSHIPRRHAIHETCSRYRDNRVYLVYKHSVQAKNIRKGRSKNMRYEK